MATREIMTTRETALRDVFYPDGKGVPNSVLLQAIPRTRLSTVLPNLGGEMLDAVQKEIQTNTDKVLQMTPLDILVEGWMNFREVAKTLEDSREKPNEPILKPLVKHTMKSEHHPSIEMFLDNASIWKLEFEITASLEVEGATLKIQDGYITHLLSGTAVGKFDLSYSGKTLAERETNKFTLPGEVQLRPEVVPAIHVGKMQETPATQACLDGRSGEVAGQTFPLTDDMVIGRSSSSSIHLSDSTVSRQHARIRMGKRQWFIQDLNSSTGIFVNGEPVSAKALQNGDIIRIGKSEFQFRE